MYDVFLFLTELNQILDRLGQRVADSANSADTTTDKTSDESIVSPQRRNVLSKKTFYLKKSYVADELGHFSVTKATDGAG